MEQMIELLKVMQKMLQEMKDDIKTGKNGRQPSKNEGRIDANNDKFDVLRRNLVSQWTSTKPGQRPTKKG
jgi:hypothetical protein